MILLPLQGGELPRHPWEDTHQTMFVFQDEASCAPEYPMTSWSTCQVAGLQLWTSLPAEESNAKGPEPFYYLWIRQRTFCRPVSAGGGCSALALPWWGGCQVRPGSLAGWCPRRPPPVHIEGTRSALQWQRWRSISHGARGSKTSLTRSLLQGGLWATAVWLGVSLCYLAFKPNRSGFDLVTYCHMLVTYCQCCPLAPEPSYLKTAQIYRLIHYTGRNQKRPPVSTWLG